jgi:hypothetical protein
MSAMQDLHFALFVVVISVCVSLIGKWPSWLLPVTALFVQNYFVDEYKMF